MIVTNSGLFSLSCLRIRSYIILTSTSVSLFIVYFIRNWNLLDFTAGADMKEPSKPCKTDWILKLLSTFSEVLVR